MLDTDNLVRGGNHKEGGEEPKGIGEAEVPPLPPLGFPKTRLRCFALTLSKQPPTPLPWAPMVRLLFEQLTQTKFSWLRIASKQEGVRVKEGGEPEGGET